MAGRMFVVAVDSDATVAQRDAFTATMQANSSIGFWHHIAPFWIVADPLCTQTATEIRDRLKALMPKVNVLVIQVTPHTWAGIAPSGGHQWLQTELHENKARWTSD